MRKAGSEPVHRSGNGHGTSAEDPARTRELAQLHAFASRVSSALLRLRDPSEICATACRLAVDGGLAVLAWVGVVEDGVVKPVARFGHDDGYVDLLRLDAGDRATGPAARALLAGTVSVCDDISADPGFRWRDEATRRGLRSAAIFPFAIGGRPAVLALYSAVVGAFRREELEVLTTLTDNLSFAVASSETEAERVRLVWALGERVKELTLLHRAARMLQEDGPLDEERLRSFVAIMPEAWLHPGLCRVRVRCAQAAAETPGFRVTPWYLSEPLRGQEGAIEIAYLEAPPGADGDPFLPEERQMVGSLAEMLSARLARDAAEAEQRGRAALARMAGDAARIGGWSLDVRTGRVTFSEELRRILEVPPSTEIDVRLAGELHPPEVREAMKRRFAECAQNGTPFDVEAPALTATGRRIWVRVIAHAERGPDGGIIRVEGATQDVHERRRLEDELRQAQKMEAIGRLAGGVAHDFNNLLSVILSYASFLVDGLPASDPLRGDAEEIVRAGERAAELTRRLLAFSRQQMIQPAVLDPREVIAGLEPMLRRIVEEDVTLVVRSAGSDARVLADRGQLEQILMNLVVNARDAMPTGGTLTIDLSDAVAAPAGGEPGARPVRHVRLEVIDTGVGMDAATLARAFEPFFTTKPKEAGTGLGLSTVYGIVQQSHGHVHLESAPGAGTRVEILLPAVDAPLHRVESRAPVAAPRGNETILVVEDMRPVRDVVAAVLRRAGYHVLEGMDGVEGLRICEQHPGPIDLLLTDVVMPNMSGPELVKRANVVRPQTKVLYMSGHAEEAIVDRGASVDVAFIPKPIVPAALLRRVRAVLGAESASEDAAGPGGEGRGAEAPTGLPPGRGRW